MNAKELLNETHSDRVFVVEDETVWVSGMNANCKSVARCMAKTLEKHDIPVSLVYDDDAGLNGGVEFRYGDAA